HRIVFHEVRDLEQWLRSAHDNATVSSARQQAARCVPPKSASGGYSARHLSVASLQRGANAQPGGNLVSDGTVPGISLSRASAVCRRVCTPGIEAISPRV